MPHTKLKFRLFRRKRVFLRRNSQQVLALQKACLTNQNYSIESLYQLFYKNKSQLLLQTESKWAHSDIYKFLKILLTIKSITYF